MNIKKMMQKSLLLIAGILGILISQGMQAQEPVSTHSTPEILAPEVGDLEGEQDVTRGGQQLNNIWRRVNKIPNIAQADQVITQQEITAGPVMLVKPGVYHLAENVTFSNSVAIIIASNDIVLDLTGRSIDGQNNGGVAIQINAGYKNVTIQNGSIKRCTCAGIFADGSAQPKEQSLYESITIKNMLIADLGLCEIESTNPNEILSILDELSENSAFDAVVEAGLGGQINLLSRAAGIFISCARKVIIEECQVCNVQGDGFFLRNVADAVVKESQAESNGADGFVFDNCDISTITGCKAERNGLHGFEELACNGDNAYRSCTARQNGVHGFRIIGAGKIVEDCISNQNTLDGFYLVTPKNSTVDGSRDITFGTNGVVTTPIGSASIINGMALQKDGKIVAVGASDNGSDLDFAVARYNPDGSLDSSFGVGGVVTTSFGGDDQAHAVAIQEDGKIVVVGYSDSSGALGFALARYTIDGLLDPDFNQGVGIIEHNLSPFDDGALSVVIQEDGKIVLGGAADIGGGNFNFAVLRYTPHGQLDTSFNGTGFVITDFGGSFDVCFDITLQSDGKIVAVGFSDAGGPSEFAVARYNTDGSLDTSFNPLGAMPGTVTTLIGTQAQGQAVTIQKDGKIVVAGVADVGPPYFALARYNIDGSLDSSFGGTGTVTNSFAGSFSVALAVAIQTDGKINAIGYTDFAGQTLVGIIRYATDGTLDPGFNAGVGAVVIGTGSGFTQAQAGLLDAQGRLLVAGDDGSPSTDFFLARVNIFKRCSMVKDSTAQANGRDGFNLEDAYNVAVLGNQASCNTRNGFVASSPAANNLYSNLSYDNTANYVSVTDLTVKPDEVSSYWANVDPDKSLFDCNMCSLVDAIDSKIDILLNSTGSGADNFIPCIFHTCSKVDIIESLVEVIDATTQEIDSTVDALVGCVEHACSVVDVIEDKVDAITPCINSTCSVVEDIDSKVDILLARDCCDCEHFIYQTDIPYVITEPGIYCLAESVQNTGLNDFLITVSSSNVVLDLGQHLMDGGTQDGLSQGAATGIIVVPGVENITIKNGNLSNFAQYAVYVGGATVPSQQEPVQNLILEDIQVVDISQFLPSTVDQLDLIGSALDSISAVAGFDKVLECCLGDQFTRIKKATGIFVGYANKVTVARCAAYNVQGDGIYLLYVQEGAINNCQSERNGGNGFVFDNCDVSAVSGSNAEQNGFNGFYEVACNGDNSYKACIAKQNGVHGFRVIGGDKTIESCIANQNTLDGFFVVTPQNSTVDGSLDITFSTDGKQTTSFGPSSNDQAFAVAGQKDGKLVVAGFSTPSTAGATSDFALARYNPDGNLDTTFGVGGKVTTDFALTTTDQAKAVVIQEDGKIIAGGTNTNDFALARYNSDGTLDVSFGTLGKVTTNLGTANDRITGLALQKDGKIVAVGGKVNEFALARYNSDGTLDASFGVGGIVTTSFAGATTGAAFAVAIQDNGKIVVGGVMVFGSAGSYALARYNIDGSLDTSFAGTGKLLQAVGASTAQINSVVIQKDDKIVAAGFTAFSAPNFDILVARYNVNGVLDTSFNGTGIVTTSFTPGTGRDSAASAVIQDDGRIIVSGTLNNVDFAIARYKTDGSLDTSFGVGGKVLTDFGGAGDAANASLLQQDGKLVAVGAASIGGNNDFALARYNIFGRCSTIRESIAQANGRDGFNLENAFNVALLNSEASCNERNGFLGSSNTANNLYSNISYNNTTNYYSVTDLTVKPDGLSSYWGNVDPSKSVFDCNVCSLVDVINTREIVINSKIDALSSCIFHVCSAIDPLAFHLSIVEQLTLQLSIQDLIQISLSESFALQLDNVQATLDTILGIVSSPPVIP